MKRTTLGYLERDGRLLMLYRNKKKDDPNAGKWIGVGGHIEPGETPETCMRRELFEETGLTAGRLDFRGLVHFLSDRWEDEDMYLFTCRDFAGEMTGCSEGELAWVPLPEVPSLPAWEGDRVFLRKLAAGESGFEITLIYEGERLADARCGLLNDNKGEGTMTYEEAKQKLAACGQEHALRYYDELDEAGKASLLAQIDSIDFSVIEHSLQEEKEAKRGVITPIGAMELPEIKEREAEFREAGLAAIRRGEVGALLLAGGMGTRLGSDAPKGTYNMGLTRFLPIFQCQFNNLLEVVREAGAYPYVFVMTSEKNDAATRAFFEEQNWFGYEADKIRFFVQEMAPATDYEGKVYMEAKDRISTSPNGNGGWYRSMTRAGLAAFAKEQGVEWLNVYAVDNVLQRMCDPVYVGACILGGFTCGGKVIRKAERGEKVGVICLEDGHPSIIEYYDMTDEMLDAKDGNGQPLYNFGVILNYLFRRDKLDEIAEKQLPLHVVEKKIPCLDEEGNLVKPETPNGHKYETLVLDMIRMMDDCLVFEVVREHEFAPVKNKTGVDSVESARELLKKNGVEL